MGPLLKTATHTHHLALKFSAHCIPTNNNI